MTEQDLEDLLKDLNKPVKQKRRKNFVLCTGNLGLHMFKFVETKHLGIIPENLDYKFEGDYVKLGPVDNIENSSFKIGFNMTSKNTYQIYNSDKYLMSVKSIPDIIKFYNVYTSYFQTI